MVTPSDPKSDSRARHRRQRQLGGGRKSRAARAAGNTTDGRKTLPNRIKRSTVRRKVARVSYYLRNVTRDLAPQSLFRQHLTRIIRSAGDYDPPYLSWRINYYNRCDGPAMLPPETTTVAGIPMKQSMFYYDLKEHARYYPRDFRLSYFFGDVTGVPDWPSFVKSRPIGDHAKNSMLFKLNKFRHFHFVDDATPFSEKKAMAVWRGGGHNKRREALCKRYIDHPLCDIGAVKGNRAVKPLKRYLLPQEQLQYKYVVSIEGVDVATNLKWILASKSLCLSPKLHYETWFMEGRLEPGKHFVKLRDDSEDLEDKILYYERHPEEALAIIRNANEFARQFFDPRREQLISLMVMHKYFVATGQLAPDPLVAELTGQR